jgi:large subunit ribosomal protein L11
MGKETIEVMVEGGKATAAPPIGPSIAPLKINVQAVVDMINEKTKEMAGMQVPVKVIVDTDTKEFEVTVGTPPVSALIKKELKLEKGAKEPGLTRVADLSKEQARKVARTKFGTDDEKVMSQIAGTARSMGVTVGQGAVTAEEKEKYEEIEKAKEEELAAKEAAHAAVEAGATPGAKPEAGAEKPEPGKPEAGAAPGAKPADAGEKPKEEKDKK